MPRRTSTVVGREFGDALRALIDRAGLTHRYLATRLGWDAAKVSDLVNGKGGCTDAELTYLLGVCDASAAECEHLLGLYRESRERGWLQFHDSGVPEQVHTLIDHERRAVRITTWSPILVPGLLQLPAYVRAAALASPALAGRDVDQLVEARIARRQIFDGRRLFTFYVQQHALSLPVGGEEVLIEQMHELLRMSVRPYISLRIVPVAAMSPFVVMKFDRFGPVVYVESLNSSLFLDDEESIRLYEGVVGSLDRSALGEEESRELITSMLT